METQKEGFFTVCDNVSYADAHLLFETRGVKGLDSLDGIEKVLITAAKATNTALPEVRAYHEFFTPGNIQNSEIKKGHKG